MEPPYHRGPEPIRSHKNRSQWKTRDDPDINSLVSVLKLNRDLEISSIMAACSSTLEPGSENVSGAHLVQYFVFVYVFSWIRIYSCRKVFNRLMMHRSMFHPQQSRWYLVLWAKHWSGVYRDHKGHRGPGCIADGLNHLVGDLWGITWGGWSPLLAIPLLALF